MPGGTFFKKIFLVFLLMMKQLRDKLEENYSENIKTY